MLRNASLPKQTTLKIDKDMHPSPALEMEYVHEAAYAEWSSYEPDHVTDSVFSSESWTAQETWPLGGFLQSQR